MHVDFPRVGAFTHNGKTKFVVWAPEKHQVEVEIAGVFFEMERDAIGYWTTTLDVQENTDYKFRIDGQSSYPDPASRFQPKSVHGPSRVLDEKFSWTDEQWKGVALSEMILYELHVGTFTREGTFQGIISRLPYLKDLGINAIELMPLSQFPGNRNWGYDGVYPFAVQDTYGGPMGLKELVNESHRLGIAVILDVVYNHQGPEGNYFSVFGPYFTDKYKTGWGSAINFDDAYSDGVRHYYWQNALMWLDEFHIDGLRLDAVHAIWDYSAKPFIDELRIKVQALEKKLGRKKVLIAEFDLNNPRYINRPAVGGYGLDGQWVDEFHHALHSLLTGEVEGYYEDFGTDEHFIKALKDVYVYTGQYSKHRKKLFGSVPSNPFDQFIVFAQNHDQIGNRLAGDRLTTMVSFESLKLGAAAFLLSPCVPMLFMGEEYGETNPFQYFISHTDSDLVKMVREGRKKEFSYFNWQGEVPDPQSEDTFNSCILSWDYESDKQKSLLLNYYKHLIHLRKSLKALQTFDRNSLTVLPSAVKNLVVYQRTNEGHAVIILLNFNDNPVVIKQSFNSSVKIIFDSSAWGEVAKTNKQVIGRDQNLTMAAKSVQILEVI